MKKILLIFILLTGTLYAQPPIAQPNDLVVCDQNGNGTEVFDLTSTIPEILNGLNPSLYTVRLYTTLTNAQNDVAAIVNPTAFPNITSPQTIYVRVFENANPTNFAITDFDLIVNLPPAIVQPPNLIKYESPFDGIASFDLTSKQFITLNGISPATVSVTYHETETAAQLGISPIPSPTAYTNIINPQTIYVKVEDAITGCFSIKQFTLTVVLSNGIVYIPDANLKTKLLQASPSYYIAKNLSGSFFNIDSNFDGEIQFAEALQVSYLYLRDMNITDMVGIENFTNLTELICEKNTINNLDISNLTNLTILRCGENNLASLDVASLSNLVQLNCEDNLITFLNLTNLNNLVYFNCSDNELSTLNVSNMTNLVQLSFSNNQIATIDLSTNVNLDVLRCKSNLLTSLDVSSLNNINYIECFGNIFTMLSFQNLPNLEYLIFGNYQLASVNMVNLPSLIDLDVIIGSSISSLDLSEHTGLTSLTIYGTDINSIDLSALVNLTTIDISGNPNLLMLDLSSNSNLFDITIHSNIALTHINLKNGTVQNIDDLFYDTSLLNLEYICCDEDELSIVQSEIDYFYQSYTVSVNTYCSFNPAEDYNTITGNIQYDFNSNSCDVSDPNANYLGLGVSIDGISTNSSVYSNGLGVFNLFTSNTGVYGLTPNLENASLFNVTPSPAEVPVMTIDNSTVTQNFCITANGVHPDLEVVIAPVIPARPGFEAVYKIVYKNKGNQVMSQNNGLNFLYNHNLMSLVSASVVPSAQATGGLQWDYANLMPFESRSILVTFLINAPTNTTNPVNIDDVLTFTAVVSPQAGDDNVTDNTFVFNQTVVGSYDPNDITCLQGNLVQPTLIGEYLHYLIRFENTGTAPAENIVVKTEIDATQYNINSLQMLAASHNASIKRTGNTLEFIFQNIQLDSGGHGNILLKIQSNGSLVEGDSVTESAAIYFDYNFPVITNDEETVFATLGINNPNMDATISIYPNPVKDVVTIRSASQIQSIQLYDVQGRLLQTMVIDKNEYQFNLSERTNGVYFVKITSDGGVKIEKIIKE